MQQHFEEGVQISHGKVSMRGWNQRGSSCADLVGEVKDAAEVVKGEPNWGLPAPFGVAGSWFGSVVRGYLKLFLFLGITEACVKQKLFLKKAC